MLKRVDPLRKELKDLETKAEDTRLKEEEITKIHCNSRTGSIHSKIQGGVCYAYFRC